MIKKSRYGDLDRLKDMLAVLVKSYLRNNNNKLSGY